MKGSHSAKFQASCVFLLRLGGGRRAHRRVEDIDGLYGSLALLLEPEDQVNPLAQRLRHLVRLQRLPVDEDEEARVAAGPRRQVHVVDPVAVLTNSKVEAWRRD